MEKHIVQISTTFSLATFEQCFDLLEQAGVGDSSVVFGGAIRDTYYADYWGVGRPVNDYDIRVWLPKDEYEAREQEFVRRLGEISGCLVEQRLSAGTDRVRHYVTTKNAELDISVRARDLMGNSVAVIAVDRASDADAGISSVAITPDGNLWSTSEFIDDIENKTISLYPRPENLARLGDYAARMSQKFPDHRVVWL